MQSIKLIATASLGIGASTDCSTRLVGNQAGGQAVLSRSGDAECSDYQTALPRILVPSDPGFRPVGEECSAVCAVPDTFSYNTAGEPQSKIDQDACRACLRGMFGAVRSGTVKYPSNPEMESMVADSQILGTWACLVNDPICADYNTFWKQSNNIPETPGEADLAAAAEAILKRNRDMAVARGFEGKKMLIISAGETFRAGGNQKRGVAVDTSEQERATRSQVAFGRYVKYAFGIETDFLVNTYQTKDSRNNDILENNNILKRIYPSDADISFRDKTAEKPDSGNLVYGSRFVIFRQTVDHAKTRTDKPTFADYSAVFFIRPDLSLKPGFFRYFQPFEKMTFGFMAARTGFNRATICDVLLYSPSTRFDLIFDQFKFTLSEWWSGRRSGIWDGKDDESGIYQPYSNFGLMVNTVAVTNSALSVNPLFEITGRKQSEVVVDADFTMDDFIGNLSLGDDKPDTSPNAVIFDSEATMIDAVKKAEVLIQAKAADQVAAAKAAADKVAADTAAANAADTTGNSGSQTLPTVGSRAGANPHSAGSSQSETTENTSSFLWLWMSLAFVAAIGIGAGIFFYVRK